MDIQRPPRPMPRIVREPVLNKISAWLLYLMVTAVVIGLAIAFSQFVENHSGDPEPGEVYPPIEIGESSDVPVKLRRYHLVRPDLCLYPDPRESVC